MTEANLDGLVGATHNYAGLSYGNIASEKNALSPSNPKKAALQGLQKMKLLHDLGVPQYIMPPHPRPNFSLMKQLGFQTIAAIPKALIAQFYSASAMWVANAATISGAYTPDGKMHITPANLVSKFHRFQESGYTARYLKQLLAGECFVHHDPLPAHPMFADEGAANHMQLVDAVTNTSCEIFVYGAHSNLYPARQSLLASQAVARLHKLPECNVIFLRQSTKAIDAGVFHNDVIAMSHGNVLIYHEDAYEDFDENVLSGFQLAKISNKELTLTEAVATYFFNSQIVTASNGKKVAIAASECVENRAAKHCFDTLIDQGILETVYYLDLRESMRNGGGPACLRLRLPLTKKQHEAININFCLNDYRYTDLCHWIEQYYRDVLVLNDLYDAELAVEVQEGLAKLAEIMSFNWKLHAS